MNQPFAASRLARVFVVSTTLAGCHDVVARPRPPLDGLAGAVVVATVPGAIGDEVSLLEARAFDPRREDSSILALTSDAEGLLLLGFSCPLERLGLTPGEVKLGPPSATPRVPPPAIAVRASLDGDEGAWARVEADAPSVASVRARIVNAEGALCASTGVRYAPEPLDLPDDALGLPLALFRLDEERAVALIASTASAAPSFAYVLSPGGRAEPLVLRGVVRAVAGAVDADGVMWLLQSDGRLARGRVGVEAAFEVVTSTAPFRSIESALVTVADQGLYISARTANAGFGLARWSEADGWRVLARPSSDFPVASFAQNEDGLFAAPFQPGLLRVRPSGIEPVEVLGNDGPFTQLEPHATLGLVVGTLGGRNVIVGRPGAWRGVELPMRTYFTRFLVAEGEGFVLGGSPIFDVQQSVFLQYQPTTGFCPGFLRLTRGFASHALRTDSGVYALSLPDLDAPTSAVFLRRVVEATSCSAAP